MQQYHRLDPLGIRLADQFDLDLLPSLGLPSVRPSVRPVPCSIWHEISARWVISVERMGEREDGDDGGDKGGFEAMGWSGDGSGSAEEGVFWALHW
jgi:hypothetical protein